jgi:uncharacterized protein YutE (UPF0331/DUF86 family)/predicted nucleotidyltransferase
MARVTADVEATLRSYFQAHSHGAYAAYLFGSVARGEARPDSDVDVAVLLEAGAPQTLDALPTALEGDLTELFEGPVQVVPLDGAPPDLVRRVLRDGRLVLDRNKSRRVAFELQARNVDRAPAELGLVSTFDPGRVTDPELVAKKLVFIEACVQDLRTLAEPARIDVDVKERRFIEHTLQIAVQATLDVASHIVSDDRLGEPRTNRELFTVLASDGWLDAALATRLEAAAGFRNLVVHGYTQVDLPVLRDVVEHRLGDLLDFVDTVRRRLA